MVKRDGTITAIIDWDSAGWFPKYWEYTKAVFTPYAPDDWIESIGEMTGRYDEQLAGERKLYKLCGHDGSSLASLIYIPCSICSASTPLHDHT